MGKTDWRPATVVWDLDGTLAYWRSLRVVPAIAVRYLWALTARFPGMKVPLAATRAYLRTLKNPGRMTHDDYFNRLLGRSIATSEASCHALTQGFVNNGTLDDLIRRYLVPIPEALALVENLYQHRIPQCVATSPVMPSAFNRRRLDMVGYAGNRFIHVTGSEFYHFHKHQAAFYTELVSHIGGAAEDVVMIGNDTLRDVMAEQAGIRVFLLETPYTRRRTGGQDLRPTWQGDYQRLASYLNDGFPFPT